MSRSSPKIKVANNRKPYRERLSSRRGSDGVFECGKNLKASESVLLYRLVFLSRKAVMLTLLLCLCFLSQPFNHVFANETTDGSEFVEEVAAPEPEIEVTEEPPPEEPSVEESVSEEELAASGDEQATVGESLEPEVAGELEQVESPVADESVASSSPNTSDDSESLSSTNTDSGADMATSTETTTGNATSTPDAPPTQTASTTEDQGSDGSSNSDDSESETESSDEQSATSSDTTATDNQDATPESSSDSGSSSSDNEDSDEETLISASSTEETEEDESVNNGEFVSLVQSDSHFSFSREECTRIEDGSFYCQKNDHSQELEDDLFAAPDNDGDMEIYLVRDGQRYQITKNTVDDASPYYDELTGTIVWHRLINDRYQIISYDIESGEEEQLTATGVNNMEPSRHGDYTVWQRWVENNWEIILFDGNSEIQITDTSHHDLAPSVRGNLVIWNTQDNDGSQSLRAYDIENRTYTSIKDGEGVSVSNPRMIVMYEAVYENGDVVMKGFDLVSGEIVPLHSLPRELPEEIPDSEPTEETRALIQQKPEPRETQASTTSDSTASSSPPLPTPEPSDTLDLRPASTTEDVSEPEVPEEVVNIPDLVISSSTPESE